MGIKDVFELADQLGSELFLFEIVSGFQDAGNQPKVLFVIEASKIILLGDLLIHFSNGLLAKETVRLNILLRNNCRRTTR